MRGRTRERGPTASVGSDASSRSPPTSSRWLAGEARRALRLAGWLFGQNQLVRLCDPKPILFVTMPDDDLAPCAEQLFGARNDDAGHRSRRLRLPTDHGCL